MTDPNEDLIGLEIPYAGDGCAYIVDGTVPWSNDYVTGTLVYENGTVLPDVIKTAAVVRRRLELDNADA